MDRKALRVETRLMHPSVRTLAAMTLLSTSCAWAAGGYSAVAQLPGGLSLQVLDRALSCNNGPGAFVFREGQKVDQTCNVKINKDGVSVLFPGYGKRVFFSKDQFSMMPLP